MRIPRRSRISLSSLDSQKVHLRHDFSATEGECTRQTFLLIFFERFKNLEEKNRNPQKKTGKSGLLIAKSSSMPLNCFSATHGECTQYNFPHCFGFERYFVNRGKLTENQRGAEESGKFFCN